MALLDDLSFGYIKRIRLSNIRGFKDFEFALDVQDKVRMKSVIIGRNGTGKSTLLRSIALALSPQSEANALITTGQGSYVRQGEFEGMITLQVIDLNDSREINIEIIIEGEGSKLFLKRLVDSGDPQSNYFVCAYGAGRGLTGVTSEDRYRQINAVGSLFDYENRLMNTEIILRRLFDYEGQHIFEPAMHGIKRLLELREDHQIEFRKGGGVQISGPGVGDSIPLDAWADGYRMTFNWLIDLYGRAMQAGAITDKGGIRGILILDEIEQHLHPSMQSDLLNQLHTVCPELQIFASTHSPLTALGAGEDNIISLQRDPEMGDIRRVPVPKLGGYSSEDALVEDALFGTDPYPQTTRDDLTRYRELTQKSVADFEEGEEEELQEILFKLDPSTLPAQKDDPILEKLDEVLRLLEEKEGDQ